MTLNTNVSTFKIQSVETKFKYRTYNLILHMTLTELQALEKDIKCRMHTVQQLIEVVAPCLHVLLAFGPAPAQRRK